MTSNRPGATAHKQIENERVIVTEWRFEPGAETGWHRHDYDYIVVPGLSGSLLLETAEGENIAHLEEGVSYFRPVGVKHNVVNVNEFEFYFIEIELK